MINDVEKLKNDAEKLKNDVFSIIGANNTGFEDDKQFCFACGVAFMALLYIKDETKKDDIEISNTLLNSPNLKQLKEYIISLIKRNLDYVKSLPFYKKNLFTYITEYEPNVNNLYGEYKEYLTLGTSNLNTFFELELIKLADYAKIHGVTPSAVRYHISQNNLKTAQKAGKNWVINMNEPYPVNKRI